MNLRDVTVIIAHDMKRGDAILNRCLSSIPAVCQVFVASEGDVSQARNQACEKADGKILIFLDDDASARAGCFEELLAPFQDPQVGVVGGVNLAFEGISFEEQIGATLLASPLTMFKSASRYEPRGGIRETDESEIVGCVMAIRTLAFNQAGGFPKDIIPCEENVLINRIQALGWKVIYTPFAVVYHRRPRVFLEYSRAVFHYGKGRGIMMRKHAGSPRMLGRPNRKWLYYGAGFVVHYVSYGAGMIWGWLNGE